MDRSRGRAKILLVGFIFVDHRLLFFALNKFLGSPFCKPFFTAYGWSGFMHPHQRRVHSPLLREQSRKGPQSHKHGLSRGRGNFHTDHGGIDCCLFTAIYNLYFTHLASAHLFSDNIFYNKK